MKDKDVGVDQRKIYFAGKAVHVYKHFRAKHARATNLVNQSMGVDDTYPPMIRTISPRLWKNWKKIVVLLEKWVKKEGLEKFKDKILLHICVVVLIMMVNDEERLERLEVLRLDSVQ